MIMLVPVINKLMYVLECVTQSYLDCPLGKPRPLTTIWAVWEDDEVEAK